MIDDLPTILGRYRLVERLGYGGTCQVFRAEYRGDSGFEKEVAIKTLLPSHRGDPDLERQFAREAQLGARLTHRNLVSIDDFGVDRGVRYLRMELVEGRTLAEALERGTPRLSVGLAIVAEVVLGLRYLHTRREEGRDLGFVHRDVSPSNILISRHGEVRLADYGLLKATRRRPLTRAGVNKGTIAYMSPEQARGETLGPRSDQFPVGSLLSVLAGGEHPFAEENQLATLERIRSADPRPLGDLADDVRRVVETCLAAEPEGRFDGMTALYRAVASLREARAVAGPLTIGDWILWR